MPNISSPITLLQIAQLDAKLCNWYVSGATVVVETIPEYLARVTINRRIPATLISILLPREGFVPLPSYPYGSFGDVLSFYDIKFYHFNGGLADENFVEFIGTGEWVENIYKVPHEQFPIDLLYFTKNGIDYYLSDIPKANGVVFGGLVSWISGLSFSVSPAAYYIVAILYTTESETITLNVADPLNPRIDLIVVGTDGLVSVIEGTPAENPQKPTPDPETQIELTQILVPAGATEPAPSAITSVMIYNENVEWTGSSTGVTVNFDDTTLPFNGSKVTNVGTITDNNTIVYTGASPVNASDFQNFIMNIKLKQALTNQQSIRLKFYMDSTLVSNEIILALNKTLIGSWQNITIPIGSISFTSGTFNKIEFKWVRSGGSASSNSGFYLDFIKVESGLQQPIFNTGIELEGDVSGTGTTGAPVNTTLATVLSNPGTFGGATNIPQITVDGKGRVTSIQDIAVSFTQMQVDWDEVDTGSPAYINNKPAIPSDVSDLTDTTGLLGEDNVQSDWNQVDTGADDYIKNKPSIPPNTDEKVKYDASDPTAGYLSEKIIAGTNVTLTEGTGADENKLVISATGVNYDPGTGEIIITPPGDDPIVVPPPGVGQLLDMGAYGLLYTSYAVFDARGLAPAGWRVANLTDWQDLVYGNTTAMYKFKSTDPSHWQIGATTPTDEYGTKLIGTGRRSSTGSYSYFNQRVYYWVGTDIFLRFQYDTDTMASTSGVIMENGCCVRICRENTDLAAGENSFVIDNDGNYLPTKKINNLEWTTVNLFSRKYRDGSTIPLITDNTEWASLSSTSICSYPNGDGTLVSTPGTFTDVVKDIYSKEHNTLKGLQGGDASLNEHYHLTKDQYDFLVALMGT